jgi:methyl-accepting chemotaxis protein
MTTDIVVLERAIVVMAVCMGIQTLLCIAGSIAAFVAWRRAGDALAEVRAAAEAQAREFRIHLGRMSETVDETARALRHGTAAVEETITDMRDAVGNVRDVVGKVGNSVGTVASVVTARRAALAVGLWQGVQTWRRRREEQRLATETGAEL